MVLRIVVLARSNASQFRTTWLLMPVGRVNIDAKPSKFGACVNNGSLHSFAGRQEEDNDPANWQKSLISNCNYISINTYSLFTPL